MTAKEMIVEFGVVYGNIRKPTFRDFKEPEILVLLNNEVRQFIEDVTTPLGNKKNQGFEVSQKRLDDIREVLVRVPLPVYNYIDEPAVYADLPYNYYKLIDDTSRTTHSCVGYTTNKVLERYYIAIVPYEDTCNAFDGYKITLDNGESQPAVFDIDDYYPDGFDDKRKFELIPHILSELNKINTYFAYWEKFNNFVSSSSFIIYSTYPFTATLTVGTKDVTYTATEYQRYRVVSPSNGVTGKYPNRLYNSQEVRNYRRIGHYKSIYDSPISELLNRQLIVYHENKFVVDSIEIVYVIDPIPISVELNISCPLSTNVHREIVRLAAEKASLIANNPSANSIILSNQNLK